MATFELNTGTVANSTEYTNSGRDRAEVVIVKVTDDETDLSFNIGDTVTVDWRQSASALGTPFKAEYIGTVTVDGKDYMVLKDAVGFGSFAPPIYYVVGVTRGDAPSSIVETGPSANVTAESFTVCFFPGTLIVTPYGECKVEELVSGDLVLVGESRVVPVKWIGRQTVSTFFGSADRLMPVRLAAGSLGGGFLPHSDLTVTADHAMLVDGVLCEAATLVNGTTITRVPLSEFGDSYTVYHVETEAHEIILANGAPAETFVDNVSRRAFDNFAEFERLHGDPPEMKELPYPRASNERHLPARIKARLGLDLRARRPRRTASWSR